MKSLIDTLESQFDSVVIDAPPLLPVTDAAVLAQQVGGVVLVIGCHKTKQQEVEKSLATLELVDADILGVVLNRVRAKGPDAYAYGSYSYVAEPSNLNVMTTRTARAENSENSSTPNEEDFDNILRGLPTRASRRA